jgi:dihydrofolate reductase
MAKVVIDLTMSLDGFITGPNPDQEHGLGLGEGSHLHDWYFRGKTASKYSEFIKPTEGSEAIADEVFTTVGAMVVGRRFYDIVGGWGGSHPIKGVPVFIVTHREPPQIPRGTTPFTVVTEGLESAVQQAKAAAGDKTVTVGGANIAQQCLKMGVVDEIVVHVAPLLLGDGTRLFEHLGNNSIRLKKTEVIDTPNVTHLRYRVLK